MPTRLWTDAHHSDADPGRGERTVGDTSLENLDALVGRNVVGAVLVHCIYTCTAISDGHPMMRVVGNPVRDIAEHEHVTLVDADTIPDRLQEPAPGHDRRMN